MYFQSEDWFGLLSCFKISGDVFQNIGTPAHARFLDEAWDPALWVKAVYVSDHVATLSRLQNLVDANKFSNYIRPDNFLIGLN